MTVLSLFENSAHQFHNKQGEEHYVLAGYPWFKCRARDLFISLPGLTLAVDEQDEFEDVMRTAEKAIYAFIEDKPVGYKIYEMEHPDVLYGQYGLYSSMPRIHRANNAV